MKSLFNKISYIAICVAIVYTCIYALKAIKSLHTEENETKTHTTKVVDTPKMTYTITYKDGTTSKIEATSYIWDEHKIKFLINDTVKVKEISGDIVEDIKF